MTSDEDVKVREDFVLMSNIIMKHDFLLRSIVGNDYDDLFKNYKQKKLYKCEQKLKKIEP